MGTMRMLKGPTKKSADTGQRKRPVNLTLSETLLKQARDMTDNLSGVVEQLLADFVARERRAKLVRSETAEKTVALCSKTTIAA